MHLTKSDITTTPKLKRLNLINSISGIKPANLIGTISSNHETNLAIFSSVIHLGSHPALLGFVVRPDQEVRRHTYENILDTHVYTINHVGESFIERAHYTSARFEKNESEFLRCGLTEEYVAGFEAPFVKESIIKTALRFVEEIHIKSNDTRLIIGEIEHLIVPDEMVDAEGHINMEHKNVGISGLNSYYKLTRLAKFPYARPNEVPAFRTDIRS
jgi:flavin reductase (DIM6/NTAB) family NADH-FMN oxidoreductase RutF